MEIKKGDFIQTSWEKRYPVEVMGFSYNDTFHEDKIVVRAFDSDVNCYEWAVGSGPQISDDHSHLSWASGNYFIQESGETKVPDGIHMDKRKSIAVDGWLPKSYKEADMCLDDFKQAAKVLQAQLKSHNCSDARIKKLMTDVIKDATKNLNEQR